MTHYTHDKFFADEPRRHTSRHLVTFIATEMRLAAGKPPICEIRWIPATGELAAIGPSMVEVLATASDLGAEDGPRAADFAERLLAAVVGAAEGSLARLRQLLAQAMQPAIFTWARPFHSDQVWWVLTLVADAVSIESGRDPEREGPTRRAVAGDPIADHLAAVSRRVDDDRLDAGTVLEDLTLGSVGSDDPDNPHESDGATSVIEPETGVAGWMRHVVRTAVRGPAGWSTVEVTPAATRLTITVRSSPYGIDWRRTVEPSLLSSEYLPAILGVVSGVRSKPWWL